MADRGAHNPADTPEPRAVEKETAAPVFSPKQNAPELPQNEAAADAPDAARDDAQTEARKNDEPAAPAPSPSNDREAESEAVGEVHKRAREHEARVHSLSIKAMMDTGEVGASVGSGLRASGQLMGTGADLTAAQQEKKKAEKFAHEMAKRAFEEHLAELMAQIDALNKRLSKIDERLEDIRRMEQAGARLIAHLQNGGNLELDENGRLKDKDAERMLQEHERRTGTKIDRNDPQAIILALRLQQQDGFNAERQNLSNEQERLREERDRLQTQLEQSTADAEADGVITPEEADRIRQALRTQDAEVSGLATISSRASEQIKEIAAGSHNETYNENASTSLGNNADDLFGGSSIAAALEGDATYSKGVANDFSLRPVFAASASPQADKQELDQAGPARKITQEFGLGNA